MRFHASACLSIFLILPSICFAQDTDTSEASSLEATGSDPALSGKTAALTADNTMKKSARKVAFAPEILGRGDSSVSLSYTVCRKVGKETKCSPGTPLNFEVSNKNYVRATDELHAWVITQRLDKVTMNGTRANILVKNKKMSVSVPNLKPAPASEMKREEFRGSMLEWLNEGISPSMQKLLEKSLLERYENLPERERDTFMTERAQEVGMPVEFISKLMNSAFSFAMYIDQPTGSVSLSQGTRTVYINGQKSEIPVWTASVSLDGTVELSINQ